MNKEEHYVSYTAPNVVRVLKSETMKLVGNVQRMGKTRNALESLAVKHERNTRVGVDGRIIV